MGSFFSREKYTGVCYVIGMMIAAYYWITAFDIHPIESIKDAIHRRFWKKEETTEE